MNIFHFIQIKLNKAKKKRLQFFYLGVLFLIRFTIINPLICIFAILIFYPIKFFKIKFLRVDTTRMGHFAGSLDGIYNEIINKNFKNFKIIVFYNKPICNYFLLNLFRDFLKQNFKKIPLIELNYIYITILNFYRDLLKSNVEFLYERDTTFNLYHTKKNFLKLNKNHEYEGKKLREKLGIKDNAKLICVNNRDSLYLNKHYKSKINFEYHNYRDFSLKSMIPALQYFTENGFYVVRFGNGNIETVSSYTSNSKIIDYSNHPLRTDFGDIYFNYICEFYFGSGSGAWNISRYFRKAGFLINICPIRSVFSLKWNYPMLFKKIFDLNKKKFLSIREIVDQNLIAERIGTVIESKNLNYVENSEEEILNLAKEALKIISNGKIIRNENYTNKLKQFHRTVFSDTTIKREKRTYPNQIEENFLYQLEI